MKNSDLDFIKEKFDNSDVYAPTDMDEQFVLDKIRDKKVKTIDFPYKKRIKVISGIAACIAVFAILFAASKQPFNLNIEEAKTDKAAVKAFSSYGEIQKVVRNIEKQSSKTMYQYSDIGISSAENNILNDSSSVVKQSDNYADTYKQVDSVDEGDIIKTDGKYIYYVCSGGYKINIYTTEGKNSKLISDIKFTPGDDIYLADTDEYIEDIYVNQNTLSAITFWYGADNDKSETRIHIFDLSDIKNIKKVGTFSQSGEYSSSRMIGSMLYLVSSQNIDKNSDVPRIRNGNEKDKKLAPDCIYSVKEPENYSFLVISSIDTENLKKNTQTKAILGAASDVYCNEKNMYVTTNKYANYYTNCYEEDVVMDHSDNNVQTQIIKINLENGINFTASATVDGYINDQYSLDEYNGYLRVAVTTQNKGGKDINNLYVLNSKLKKVGRVTGFAKNESIKAVKYVEDTAYVITYEETDPLFAIDLSVPENPKILGSVKIDGFSSMLVPIDNNTLLGIGFSTKSGDDIEITDGIKLVAFDVKDKSNPKVLDTKVYKNSESEVQYNPKALVYNEKRNNFTIPINYYDNSIDEENEACGTVTFRVNNGKIVIEDEYNSDKFIYCNRCTFAGNTIYLLSDYDDEVLMDCTRYK